MDIRHLRYFMAVADALSFAKAARELHMSQPPLSKRIAEMEEHLGVRLFDRASRHVRLTPAGEALLPQARVAVQAFDAALRVARAVSPSHSRRLRIALTPDTSRGVLLELVNQLHRQSVEVSISEATTSQQLQLLEAGEIDVGVLRHPFETKGLKFSSPLAQSLGVLMHSNHPLAQRDRLQLADLCEFPLVQFQRHYAPGLYDEMLEVCREGGYVPSKVLHGVRLTAAWLTTENAITFTSEQLLKRRGQSGTGELVWKPLEGNPMHWWTSAVCRQHDWDALTRIAVNAISDLLQEHEHWIPMARPSMKRGIATRTLKRAQAA